MLNHADELISQLRVLGRLEDFGSGARFKQQFRGSLTEERLHWHLRRRCFVRRRKAEVLPQLPDKRQVVVPVAFDNEREYQLAEDDVIAWLREQPLDLSELNAKIAATLRAQRLRSWERCNGLPRAEAACGVDVDPRLPRLWRAARRVRAPRRGAGGGDGALPGAAPARERLDRAREATVRRSRTMRTRRS